MIVNPSEQSSNALKVNRLPEGMEGQKQTVSIRSTVAKFYSHESRGIQITRKLVDIATKYSVAVY